MAEIRNGYGLSVPLPEWAGLKTRWAVVESTILLLDPAQPPQRWDAAARAWLPLELARAQALRNLGEKLYGKRKEA